MCREEYDYDRGYQQFFRVILSHESLFDYYKINFSLMQFHKYSLGELENQIPWEREIYLMMLAKHIQKENEAKQRAMG